MGPRAYTRTYLDCSFLLDFLESRGLSFILPLLCDSPKDDVNIESEWRDVIMFVHSTKQAERSEVVSIQVKTEDKRQIWCEALQGKVVLVSRSTRTENRRTLSARAARELAAALIRAATKSEAK